MSQNTTTPVQTPTPRKAPRSAFKPGQSGNPLGRPKGTPNVVTKSIKEAIELACRPGACHPEGLAGWLIERAQGGVQDRQIFAGLVAKVIPAQLQANIDGNIVVQLPWLTARNVGGRGTPTSQSQAIDAQVIDITLEKGGDLRVGDPKPALEAPQAAPDQPDPTPHPPFDRQAGGGAE